MDYISLIPVLFQMPSSPVAGSCQAAQTTPSANDESWSPGPLRLARTGNKFKENLAATRVSAISEAILWAGQPRLERHLLPQANTFETLVPARPSEFPWSRFEMSGMNLPFCLGPLDTLHVLNAKRTRLLYNRRAWSSQTCRSLANRSTIATCELVQAATG
ncbi:hypothetical protein NA57DRAFT_52357 [Rhizodiscina lignyota]|uniref:Uncharacterized protein n=1 Tax=Rhizodiscina lignyota TaxID=1504668 RepID=A0A9P4MA32_9PEZI|nr:hypothetical protein NA57DRAFT_52357 [Rhizodiscina lignyota]